MFSRNLAAYATACAGFLLIACAPPNYNIKAPSPSGLKYLVTGAPQETNFSLLDERRVDGKVFSHGILPAELKIDNVPIDPVPFLASQLQAEFASRGLPAKVSASGTTPPAIHLKSYHMENMRTNAYTPFFTLTYISADVEAGGKSSRVGVFVARGKTPVWSFDEIIDPVFNQPLSLGIQEFATKIANLVYGYRASDETVKTLTTRLNGPRTPNSFLDVYALGFTNNPAAIDTLVGLARDEQEYVRQAAISSLGNLGATTQFGLLKSIYQDPKVSWQDHSIALKAIADLNTDESKAFVTTEAKRLGSESAKESQVLGRILALYL